jgi:hypothetical protein
MAWRIAACSEILPKYGDTLSIRKSKNRFFCEIGGGFVDRDPQIGNVIPLVMVLSLPFWVENEESDRCGLGLAEANRSSGIVAG